MVRRVAAQEGLRQLMTIRRIRPSRLLVVLAAAIVLLAGTAQLAPPAAGQDDGTPEAATPEAATPVVLSPEENRAGRLGGMLSEIQAELGDPDWADTGLIGYNSADLGGVDTIMMVYYDEQERVRSFLLVYLEQPEELDDPEAIAGVVADVAPRDGECEDEPVEDSNLDGEVFACRSDSLKGLYSAAQLLDFGVVGEDGTYSYAVDPTEDDGYYEIAVRFGTDGPPVPPTPVPTPTPTPGPPLSERYPPVDDVLELLNADSYEIGEELSFAGTVATISVELEGTVLQVEAVSTEGSIVVVRVVNDGDLEGIGPGAFVEVYGLYGGAECDDSGFCAPTVYMSDFAV
jgi:hypothetical protein